MLRGIKTMCTNIWPIMSTETIPLSFTNQAFTDCIISIGYLRVRKRTITKTIVNDIEDDSDCAAWIERGPPTNRISSLLSLRLQTFKNGPYYWPRTPWGPAC